MMSKIKGLVMREGADFDTVDFDALSNALKWLAFRFRCLLIEYQRQRIKRVRPAAIGKPAPPSTPRATLGGYRRIFFYG